MSTFCSKEFTQTRNTLHFTVSSWQYLVKHLDSPRVTKYFLSHPSHLQDAPCRDVSDPIKGKRLFQSPRRRWDNDIKMTVTEKYSEDVTKEQYFSSCTLRDPRFTWIPPSSGMLRSVGRFCTDVSGLRIGPILKLSQPLLGRLDPWRWYRYAVPKRRW